MRKIIILLLLTCFSSLAFGQTNYEKFQKLFKDDDTTKIISLLNQWEKENSNDPEFYTSAFNYYFSKSKQEVLSLDKEQKYNESFQLKDSTGKVAGYLSSNISYYPEKLFFDFAIILT